MSGVHLGFIFKDENSRGRVLRKKIAFNEFQDTKHDSNVFLVVIMSNDTQWRAHKQVIYEASYFLMKQ